MVFYGELLGSRDSITHLPVTRARGEHFHVRFCIRSVLEQHPLAATVSLSTGLLQAISATVTQLNLSMARSLVS